MLLGTMDEEPNRNGEFSKDCQNVIKLPADFRHIMLIKVILL